MLAVGPWRLTCALVLAGAVSCGDRTEPPEPGSFATAREDDPPLIESWRMPAGSGALRSGDLGSKPTALAQALMTDHAAAGISYRIATHCRDQGALANVESLALRFSVGQDGTLVSMQGDPTGPAATCTTDALRAELSGLTGLPAGAALMVLRFSTEPAS